MGRSVDVDEVKAVIEWQHHGETHWLIEPDPRSSNITFALRLDADGSALFEIVIPIKYKGHPPSSAVYIHVKPESITSFKHSIRDSAPNQVFSSPTCLDLEHNNAISILIPTFIKEPVVAARPRSGYIIDSLSELLQTTSLRIYIPDNTVSLEHLDFISTTVTEQKLKPFTGPDFDISRLFTGSGAKVTTLPKPPPPSYNKVAAQSTFPPYTESATFDPSTHKRKRSQETAEKPGPIWAKPRDLETIIQSYAAAQDALIQKQHAEIVELRDKLARCEKQVSDLAAEVAGLRQARDEADDAETVQLIELQEDIHTLEGKYNFITGEKDDEEFMEKLKDKVVKELITRISRE